MSSISTQDHLKKSTLGVADIVFFVVAAAAPLGATLGVGPVIFSIGGASAPGLFLIASVILFLFAVGLAAMSRHVISAGGFAEIVTRGLGRNSGYAAAGVAMLAYTCMLCGIYGQIAGFGAETFKAFLGIEIDWRVIALAALVTVGFFGYIHIDLSAKVLGVLMVFEVLILLIFDIAVLVKLPSTEIKLSGFFPSDLGAPGVGVALMFAFSCFIGFESTTIYGEEARNPERTIPRATYYAIGIIAIFYVFTMWCIGLAYGATEVQGAATVNMVNFVFDINTRFVGAWATAVMQILAFTSVFAVLLSFHNALSRYFFALARSNFLPKALSHVHEIQKSPSVASLTLSVICLLVLVAFMLAGADPIADVFMLNVAIGTLAILSLQTLGAFAVIGYFRKNGGATAWQGFIAPALGAVGLSLIVGLAFLNFGDLSGAKDGLAKYLPGLILVAVVVGVLNGYLKSRSLKSSS